MKLTLWKKLAIGILCISICGFCAQSTHNEPLEVTAMAAPLTTPVVTMLPEEWHDYEKDLYVSVPYIGYVEPPFDAEAYVDNHYEDEITMLAKTVFLEARGIESQTEQACVVWTILNRVDAREQSIEHVITAPYQFAYSAKARTVDDQGHDLKEFCRDILVRWIREKHGEDDVGRVLPKEWQFFAGHDDGHNYFRKTFESRSYWEYDLDSPYDS